LNEKQNVPILNNNVPILRTNVPKNQTNVPFSEKIVPIDEKEQNFKETSNDNLYTCDKCNKNYKTHKTFIHHDAKCNGVDKLTCPRCMKSFSSRQHKHTHIKNNKCKPRSIIHARQPNTNNTINTQKKRTQNNITNNTNSHNTINNIYINNYGKERMDYLTYEKILHIYKKGYNIPSALIEAIHFNKDFPENNNIKYIDKYTAHIKVDDDFISRNMNTLIYDMMNKKIEVMINLLQLYGEKLKEDVDKLTYEDIEDILNNYLAKLPKEKYKEQFYKTRDICKNYTDKNCE
jgi:hypothetical protein